MTFMSRERTDGRIAVAGDNGRMPRVPSRYALPRERPAPQIRGWCRYTRRYHGVDRCRRARGQRENENHHEAHYDDQDERDRRHLIFFRTPTAPPRAQAPRYSATAPPVPRVADRRRRAPDDTAL